MDPSCILFACQEECRSNCEAGHHCGNKRIQIKSRTIFDESKSGQRIGQLNIDQAWDSVVLVLMDEEYEPYEIYEAEREDILEYINSASSGRAKRGALSPSPIR